MTDNSGQGCFRMPRSVVGQRMNRRNDEAVPVGALTDARLLTSDRSRPAERDPPRWLLLAGTGRAMMIAAAVTTVIIAMVATLLG
ncbi:hypothetical protein ACF08N_37700 [Streptomyces sp. NPDC015127]|uniref:hypothetical protein n=1 Tax=Streptomyces sp. NPDC015127 TaxID=3364939 RepID=UPI0036F89451